MFDVSSRSILTANSTSRCNRQGCLDFEEYLARGSEAEGLSRTVVEMVHHVFGLSFTNGG